MKQLMRFEKTGEIIEEYRETVDYLKNKYSSNENNYITYGKHRDMRLLISGINTMKTTVYAGGKPGKM